MDTISQDEQFAAAFSLAYILGYGMGYLTTLFEEWGAEDGAFQEVLSPAAAETRTKMLEMSDEEKSVMFFRHSFNGSLKRMRMEHIVNDRNGRQRLREMPPVGPERVEWRKTTGLVRTE
jgi:hypothetical protein